MDERENHPEMLETFVAGRPGRVRAWGGLWLGSAGCASALLGLAFFLGFFLALGINAQGIGHAGQCTVFFKRKSPGSA